MNVREVSLAQVTEAVAANCVAVNTQIGRNLRQALQSAQQLEESDVGQVILLQILANADIAEQDQVPMCQDTGLVVVFAEVGQDVRFVGSGTLEDAINAGVRQGFLEGYLRMSMVRDPLFDRTNTGDNTPAVVHTRLVPGDRVRLVLDTKGGGAENMSCLAMLAPADGLDGVKRFIVETVRRAGPNACPPLIVGVGVGGNFERCALLAKWAITRPVGAHHPDGRVQALEEELLAAINRLGIGPQGLGGTVTALAVHVETFPCHIAALPVAVNLECHSHRCAEILL